MSTVPRALDRPLKIAVVLDRPRVGGAEMQTFSLMRALAQRGHSLDLVCFNADVGAAIDLPTEIPVAHLGFERMSDLKGWRAMADRLNALGPDLVYGANWLPIAALGGAKTWFGLKAPVINSFHSTGFANAGERNRSIMTRAGLLATHTLVYVSENQRRYWRRRGLFAQHNTVIHNGVDPQRFRPPSAESKAQARLALGLDPDDIVVVLSARFRIEKNHVQLVEAVRRLRGQGRPFTALFLGDGPTRPMVEKAVRDGACEAFVRFAGEHADVRPFLAAADIATLTSTTVETLSMAALEAMAMGLPLALSEIGGASEMARNGETGFLFPAGDTEALMNRLGRLAEPNLRRRMGQNARALVESAFSEQRMVDRYAALFSSVVARRGRERLLA